MSYTLIENGLTTLSPREDIMLALLLWRAYDTGDDLGVAREVKRLEYILEEKDKQNAAHTG